MAQKPRKNKRPRSKGRGYCTEYVNRWGKLMRARDYGYKAWPFGRK